MIHAFRLVGLWTQVMARVRVLETLQALTSSLFKRPEYNVSWFCIGLGIGPRVLGRGQWMMFTVLRIASTIP